LALGGEHHALITPLLHVSSVLPLQQLAWLAVESGPVPQLAADEGHAGHEPIGREGLHHFAGLRVHLVDARLAELPDEQVSVGPRHAARATVHGSANLPTMRRSAGWRTMTSFLASW
jgi:hypothetical protein